MTQTLLKLITNAFDVDADFEPENPFFHSLLSLPCFEPLPAFADTSASRIRPSLRLRLRQFNFFKDGCLY
jgi:hypothetical protein